MGGGVKLYDGVLSMLPPSALPMHINNDVNHMICACPFTNFFFFL